MAANTGIVTVVFNVYVAMDGMGCFVPNVILHYLWNRDLQREKFSTRTRPEPESIKFLRHNSSVQYSNLCRLQNNFWYKSNFKFQYFSEKKLVFKPEPDPNKKVETRKKLVFKPEPDPISDLSRVEFLSFRVPDAGLCYGNL